MRIFEIVGEDTLEKIKIENHVIGFEHGQMDARLEVTKDGKSVGHLSYSVYQGEPSIKMIMVAPAFRNTGIGRTLVKRLQSLYPDREIDWGMLTQDGSALKIATKFKTTPNPEWVRLNNQLDLVRSKLDSYQKMADDFNASPSEEARLALLSKTQDWNDLHDEQSRIEDELRNMKPETRIIEI